MDKLISYIVPCYNGAKTIHRLFDSLLKQTYTNLEIIVVDDGSTDDSAAVIKGYVPRFEEKGMTLVYHYQKNTGLGGAIDAGLKLFHGEYLCWVDVDDFFAPDASEARMLFLEEHPEISVVSSDAYIVNEDALDVPIKKVSAGATSNDDPNQFWHMLRSNTIFCPGCHMARVKDFLVANPTRSIYPARRGQNWQLLLPLYYQFKHAFLDKPLFYYVVSPNSMSRDHGDPKKELFRCDEHQEIIAQTLSRIDMKQADREKAERIVQEFYARKRLYIAGRNGLAELAQEQLAKLEVLGVCNKKDRMQARCAKNGFIRWIYKILK